MAKKKSRRSRASGGKKSGRGVDSRKEMSDEQLRECLRKPEEHGRLREAVAAGRELVVRRQSQGDEALLAAAYRARVEEFLAKGQERDVLTLLDDMAAACPHYPPPPSWRFALLVRLARLEEAARLLLASGEDFPAAYRRRAEEIMACCLLLGKGGLERVYPPQSSMAEYTRAAGAALAALAQNNDEQLAAALKKIGLRSPFRHLRSLLSALVAPEPQAGKRLASIPSDSCYYPLAQLLQLRLQLLAAEAGAPGALRFNPLLLVDFQLPGKIDNGLGLLLGLNNIQLNLLRGLPAAGDNPDRLLSLLKRFGRAIPAAKLQTATNKLLIHLPRRLESVLNRGRRGGAPPLSMLPVAAQAAELMGEADHAAEAWLNFAELSPVDQEDGALLKALAFRRAAEKMMTESEAFFNAKDTLKALRRSLEFDPADRASWLKLFELSEKYEKANQSYKLLKEAVAALPEDVELLLKAAGLTLRRNALKMAIDYAERLLRLDPINSRGKELLALARLGQARKLARQGKKSAALSLALETQVPARQALFQGRPLICAGMIELKAGKQERGEELLSQGSEQAISLLFARLLCLIEAHCLGLKASLLTGFRKSLAASVKTVDLKREDISRLASWVIQPGIPEETKVPGLGKTLNPLWRAAAKHEWQLEQGLHICRACRLLSCYPALAALGKKLRKKWPDHPELIYLTLYGKSQGGARKLSPVDKLTLENAMFQLSPYSPLASRIESLLRQAGGEVEDFDDDDPFIQFEQVMNELMGGRGEGNQRGDGSGRRRKSVPGRGAGAGKGGRGKAQGAQLSLFDFEPDDEDDDDAIPF